MSRVLYLDCFSGISGDMTLGALLDAGLPFDDLKRALGSLAVSGYEVTAERVLRTGIAATKFRVHEGTGLAGLGPGPEHAHDSERAHAPDHSHGSQHGHGSEHAHGPEHTHEPAHATAETHGHERGPKHPGTDARTPSRADAPRHRHPHRDLPEIFGLIDQSALSPAGRDRAKGMFQRLAEAEAAIHQMPVEKVHLHEVGALDSIIDIVGVVFGLDWIGADRIVCSPLNVGGGMVQSAHGVFPVPAPATVKLLGDAPIYSAHVQRELVTPTGALIVSSYADGFGPIPHMTIERTGYGAGERDDPTTPNVLRVLIGQAADRSASERVAVIECEIDDMNPQIFGLAMERLYTAGALEVFYVPIQMKKNRPGTLLTVIADPQRRRALADVIFRETTTIGLRYMEVERECLQREIVSVQTSIGTVRFKIAWRDGRQVNAVPEFEDCVTLATANNLSVKEVQSIALQAYGASRLVGQPPRTQSPS
jgi:uncharacterized protein (TIGR00299 family) protein